MKMEHPGPSERDTDPVRPVSLLIAALGGEGGGVLADWIVQCARGHGLPVQATSVPGVAQRTGATSYYVEWLPAPLPGGREPIFALSPVAGEVDVVAASEALEAARVMERGFVSPDRTLFLMSTHRVYTTQEKMHGGDGRFDTGRVVAAGRELARLHVPLDVDALARAHGTVPSAVLFGALAGAGAFPWPRAACEAVVRASGRGVEASLAGFSAAFDAVARPPVDAALPSVAPKVAARWAPRVLRLPPAAREILPHALARLVDHQDAAWADEYLRHAEDLCARGLADATLAEALRRLALWMAWEDIPRVADLKTRAGRLERLRATAGARDDDIVTVTEHFKPRREEIAASLPAALGRWLLARPAGRAPKARHVRTTGLAGFLLLRLAAQGRRWRRASLRFGQEQAQIRRWLDWLRAAAGTNAVYARELARLPRLRRGYGDTHARGLRMWEHLARELIEPAVARGPTDADAAVLAAAIDAALAEPEGQAFAQALVRAGAKAPEPEAKPIRIVRRPKAAEKDGATHA